MKTNTESTLFMLGLVLVAAVAFAVWSGSQVDVAAAQVGATTAMGKLPEAAIISSQVTGWALKTLIGMVAVAVGAVAVAWAKKWWRGRNSKRAWRSGPNARWQNERGPRPVSESEFMRAMMYQQMMQNGGTGKRQTSAVPLDDEIDLEF